MRVQAKRLDVAVLEYSHLDHIIGKTAVRQVDRLVDDATTRNLYPMYCFYNYWNTASGVRWPCGTFAQKTELWGVAVADAKFVRQRIDRGQKKLSEISQVSMPLMCLACCRGHADDRANPTLPHRARGIAAVLRRDPDDVPPLVPHPPWYATHQASKQSLDLPTGVADLDGVLVVEERPGLYEEDERRQPSKKRRV